MLLTPQHNEDVKTAGVLTYPAWYPTGTVGASHYVAPFPVAGLRARRGRRTALEEVLNQECQVDDIDRAIAVGVGFFNAWRRRAALEEIRHKERDMDDVQLAGITVCIAT